MLSELVIENLALFERATLSFGSGLNVVTGETGAGKSLLIDALELLLGERPRASMVRKGAEEARVEGRFGLPRAAVENRAIRAFFAENLSAVVEDWNGLADGDERELILGRAISEAGRTRAWVNHRPVTQRVLKELAGLLVEIHGQNEHQRLLDPAEQTRLLDAFAQSESALERYQTCRARWTKLVDSVADFERVARERRERADLLRFQQRELAAAKVTADERRELEEERERLRYANDLAREVGGSLGELSGDDGGAIDALRRADRVLSGWERKVSQIAPHAEELRQALMHLEESVAGLETFLGGVEASPQRLEQVESRLYEIETLETKYRTDAAGLVERARTIAAELAALDNEESDLESLVRERDAARTEVVAAAAELTKKRQSSVGKLAKAVHHSLAELGLERAAFSVRITPRAAGDAPPAATSPAADAKAPNGKSTSSAKATLAPPAKSAIAPAAKAASPNADAKKLLAEAENRRFGVDGADAVEFFLAANPGEDPAPLRQVASGGETARIMLALRTALAVRQTIPTLVFDEVDSGVGGRLGPKVGEHLRALSDRHQILCVTHLPAIAAVAHRHFKVEKKVASGRTSTSVAALDGDARVEEVADMIAGGAAHATARAEAKRLLSGR